MVLAFESLVSFSVHQWSLSNFHFKANFIGRTWVLKSESFLILCRVQKLQHRVPFSSIFTASLSESWHWNWKHEPESMETENESTRTSNHQKHWQLKFSYISWGCHYSWNQTVDLVCFSIAADITFVGWLLAANLCSQNIHQTTCSKSAESVWKEQTLRKRKRKKKFDYTCSSSQTWM